MVDSFSPRLRRVIDPTSTPVYEIISSFTITYPGFEPLTADPSKVVKFEVLATDIVVFVETIAADSVVVGVSG